jgi:hypothetical protein
VAIFQHSLPFLQSESFQTHVGTIHRRAIGPLALRNGTSAYASLTCHLPAPTIEYLHRPPYKFTCFRPTSTRSRTQLTSSFQVPFISPRHIHSNVRPLLRAQQCCLFTLLFANHARPSSIVALLRKPHICNIIIIPLFLCGVYFRLVEWHTGANSCRSRRASQPTKKITNQPINKNGKTSENV